MSNFAASSCCHNKFHSSSKTPLPFTSLIANRLQTLQIHEYETNYGRHPCEVWHSHLVFQPNCYEDGCKDGKLAGCAGKLRKATTEETLGGHQRKLSPQACTQHTDLDLISHFPIRSTQGPMESATSPSHVSGFWSLLEPRKRSLRVQATEESSAVEADWQSVIRIVDAIMFPSTSTET